ncbi:MAG: MBL fold metallo-hydrolase, partial [Methylococcales bacterium]|nr:MBL fold metallo-hydrolase [Methylococcales bacterium]
MTSPDAALSQATGKVGLQFITDETPAAGHVTEIADGIFWLRMSLPMTGLDHINLYFLRDGDEWVVVDTGINSKASKEIWKSVFEGAMNNQSVNRVICTHLHPDHTGLAGWMSRRFKAPLIMTRGEYFLCRLMVADTGKPAPQEGVDFYKRAGLTDEQIETYKSRFGGFGKAVSPMPQSYTRIQDGESLRIDGREWKIIVGSGHSPEHACLWCEELDLCLTGDQLLPNISPNIGIWPTEPDGNPLDDYLQSCHKLILALPEKTLICPAHGI